MPRSAKLVGQPAGAERWADAAERWVPAADPTSVALTPTDGSTLAGYLAMLRGLMCRNGLAQMRADIEAALVGLSAGSPWRAAVLIIRSIADLLDGQLDRADAILAHAVQTATHAAALPAASTALAERSVIAIQRHDWGQAETFAEQALAIMHTGRLDDYIMSPLVHAAAARTALHRGDMPGAKQHLARAARLRPLLTTALPHYAVQTLLELARAYLTLHDAAGAIAVLRQVRDILQLRPNLGILPEQAAKLHAKLDTIRAGTGGASSLTSAELRLLPLLPTHLSLREISQRLYISHSTVKTQVISVYRKLGVSSRSQAVQRVQQAGLLGG